MDKVQENSNGNAKRINHLKSAYHSWKVVEYVLQ